MSDSSNSVGDAVRRAQEIALDEGLSVTLAIASAAAEYDVDPLAVVELLAERVELQRKLFGS